MRAGATSLWRTAIAWDGPNRGIMAGVWWTVLLLVMSLAALPFDSRRILGLNPWIKPLKFELSIIIYLLTVGLLLAVLDDEGRLAKVRGRMGWGFGLAMGIEITLIAMQSLRGVPSHMNYTSPFNGVTFAVMGVVIAFNTYLLAKLLTLFSVTPPRRPRAEIWGIRLGLGMILAGSLEGVWLVIHGAHTVGAKDGGAGLPFLNWSTLHGDLRVPHFFALHALQLLWAGGWLLGHASLPERVRVAAVFALAAVYAGGVWWLFAQAMNGRPLLAMR